MKKGALMAILGVAVLAVFVGCRERDAAVETEGAEYKIGIVFDVGGRGDKSFNDSAYNGLVRIAEEFDGYIADDPDRVNFGTRIEMKYLEPRVGGQDREQLLRILAEDGFDLLFGVGFAFTDALHKVATDFPDVHFALIDGYIPDLGPESNITCIAFAEHEGSFMVGALAGMLTEQTGGRVGFIGGMDIPLIHKFHGGFAAGAMFVNPALRESGMVMGQYIGQDPTAFNDPQTAESIALNMYNQGAQIIYHAAGGSGTGLFKAAYDQSRWAIGVDSDQGVVYAVSDTAQERAIGERIVSSMLKRVDTSVFLLSGEYIENGGQVDGGYISFGLDDDGVGYAVNDFNREMITPYVDRLEVLRAQIIAGEITVPDSHTVVEAWARDTF